MSTLREGIRDDGTVEGYVVETHHLPLESASVDAGGFFRFVGDGGPINYEIRVPVGPIMAALVAFGNPVAWKVHHHGGERSGYVELWTRKERAERQAESLRMAYPDDEVTVTPLYAEPTR